MAIVRWNPFGELNQLQDRINRAFSDTYGRGSGPTHHDEGLMTTGEWAPPSRYLSKRRPGACVEGGAA